ncbi:MAG: hypothetical protein JWM76_2577 [Pseudonocardiales bacterium]|nr:hypothetical protein [Pseudonocardiales bacterium]
MKRLAMWSGPRNISTAMMRSWENRPDTFVVDKPLYAFYLAETGLDHPGQADVIAAGNPSWPGVVEELVAGTPSGAEIYYQKHMTHHLIPELPTDWIAGLHNVMLIRDPREVVASYQRSRAEVTAADIGLLQQVALYEQLEAGGSEVPVIDAGDFLRAPESYLRWLCDDLGVLFYPEMLSWPPGPRDSDGVWAPYWYSAVTASTGFEPHRTREFDLSGAGLLAAEESLPAYEQLFEVRVRL